MTTKSPVGRRLLDGLQARGALAQRLDLLVDRLVVGGGLAPADLEALVLAERRGRPHADLDREGQGLARAGEVLAHLQIGVADGRDARRVDGLDVPAPERGAHGLVQDTLAADAADDDRRRHLALAEPRDAQVLAERARGLLDAALDLLGRDLRLDADAGLGKLGDGRLHRPGL
jgi:hypothetical protein